MAVRADSLTTEIAAELADFGKSLAAPATESRTLESAMEGRVVGDGKSEISVPHYWARFIHDGTGVRTPKNAQFLMWFLDPAKDPRYSEYPPIRLSHYRPPAKIDPAVFRELLRTGQIRLAKSAPGIRARQFFSNSGAMAPMKEKASELAQKKTSEMIRTELRSFLDLEDRASGVLG